MNQLECSHCGHQNLSHAVYCFECGKLLADPTNLVVVPPYANMLAETTETNGDNGVPRSVETVNEIRLNREKASLYNAMLTCLRCSTINEPQTEKCVNCGANLVVSHPIYPTKTIGSARTSVGQVRTNNEDSVGIWARNGMILGLVADGMGGAAAGEVASRLAKEAIQAEFTSMSRGSEDLADLSEAELMQKLRFAVTRANRAILEHILRDPSMHGMGTTVTLAFSRGNRVLLAHVGDSRAYIVRKEHGWIHQITDDHSFVEALLNAGHITRAQAARHPMRSVLYRALGQSEALGVADLYARFLSPNDRIILCSDGLPRHVADYEIGQIAMIYDDPEEISQALIDLTNQRGAEDNVSVVVMIVTSTEDSVPLEELYPIDGEYKRKSENVGMFETGQINQDEIEKARREAEALMAQKQQDT